MIPWYYRLSILILMVAVLAIPATATADHARVSHFSGHTATANFEKTEGCVASSVSVLVLKQATHTPPGPGSRLASAHVFIAQSDICTGADKPPPLLLAVGSAPLAEGNFVVDKKLDAARLSVTVHVCDDVSDACFDTFIDLSWTGSGPLTHVDDQLRFESPTCTIKGHINGIARDVVVSGRVVAGGADFVARTTASATLTDVRSGQLVIRGVQCGVPGGHPGD